MRLPLAHRFAVVSAVLALAVSLPAPAGAAPLEVTFQPPDIPRRAVCEPRPPRHELIARWQDWSGKQLDDRSTALIRRDLRLLRSIDAERWFDTVSAAYDLLQQRDPSYGPEDRLLDRIELLIAAGRSKTVREEGLVERLVGAGGSRRAQHTAAELLLDGIAVERDEAQGLELLAAAAYAGHAEALLQLAEMTAEGQKVPNWQIEPELAVTLSFGSLVGQLDERICDRMSRIAHEFARGGLVARNPQLAARWYRLAADLGDFNAAWDLAKLHLEADSFEKDNAVLVEYLRQAAEGGLGYAQVELGKLYEHGALLPQDLSRAEELYTTAADNGERAGLVRLASLFETQADDDPEARAKLMDALGRLTDEFGPEAWALAKLADLTLASEGRWAGEEKAVELLERALEVDPDHLSAGLRLAGIGFRHADEPQAFLDLISRLQRLASIHGNSGVMEKLEHAWMCRAPEGPYPQRAAYWKGLQENVGNLTFEAEPEQLRKVLAEADPQLAAELQSQAIVGRSRAVALYARMARKSDAVQGRLDLLIDRATRLNGEPLTRIARNTLKLATTPEEREKGIERLRQAMEEGEPNAAFHLLRALERADRDPDTRRELAKRLAAQGKGIGLRSLVQLEDGGPETRRAVWERYRETIEKNGDADAITFALPFVDEAVREDYLNRFRAALNCHVDESVTMAETLNALGLNDEAVHWLGVAEVLAEEGWTYVLVADTYLEVGGEGAVERALELLDRGRTAGHGPAAMRLLSLHRTEGNGISFDDRTLATFYVDLIEGKRNDMVSAALNQLRFAEPEVRSLVEERTDTTAALRRAAEAGEPKAQFALAQRVRDAATGTEDLQEYADLLQAAAEQGHSQAMLQLSQAYALGAAVEPSVEESRRWLRRAAEAGNPEAQASLRLLQMNTETSQ